MSVMQLNPESFKKNIYGITRFYPKYAYGSTLLSSDISPLFETLQIMNAKSFSERYNDSLDYIPFKEVSITEEHKTTYSLLKSLLCLQYNIELDSKTLDHEEKFALEFLESQIERIKNHILDQIPEFKDAQWG